MGFSWSRQSGQAEPPCLIEVPGALGAQHYSRVLDYPTMSAMGAAVMDQTRILVVGSGGVKVLYGDQATTIELEGANPMGLVARSRSNFYCLTDTQYVSLFDLEVDQCKGRELGRLNLAGSISHLARRGDSLFVLSHTRVSGHDMPRPVILELTISRGCIFLKGVILR